MLLLRPVQPAGGGSWKQARHGPVGGWMGVLIGMPCWGRLGRVPGQKRTAHAGWHCCLLRKVFVTPVRIGGKAKARAGRRQEWKWEWGTGEVWRMTLGLWLAEHSHSHSSHPRPCLARPCPTLARPLPCTPRNRASSAPAKKKRRKKTKKKRRIQEQGPGDCDGARSLLCHTHDTSVFQASFARALICRAKAHGRGGRQGFCGGGNCDRVAEPQFSRLDHDHGHDNTMSLRPSSKRAS